MKTAGDDLGAIPREEEAILIVAPLDRELRALRAALAAPRAGRPLPGGGPRLVRGRLAGVPVAVAATGDGPRAAARGLSALLAALRPAPPAIFVLGVAGGLSPGLAAGDLLAAERVLDGDGDAPPPDAAWLARALATGRAQRGTAVSADRILVGRREKEKLVRSLGTVSAAIVDLESAAYGRAAAAAGIPYLVLRAVLDRADEDLPLDFNRCRTAAGGVSDARVVGRALLRPRVLPALLDLDRRLALGSRRLAELAAEILARRKDEMAGEDSPRREMAAAAH
ncbi:MAG TPA: hypothetical protein VOA87_01450 [Thermoanaerobaculia bacterium]|nr:hypothetical protein [Thermoanaerobaculia bacterium]